MANILRHLVALSLVISTLGFNKCVTYLQSLQKMYVNNRTQFVSEMNPYLILSGKTIDDLGFPNSCNSDQKKYAYTTVEVSIPNKNDNYTGYIGFCFTRQCHVKDLNEFGGFIINYIFEEFNIQVKARFVEPQLDLQFSPLALFTCFIFCIFIGIGMTSPILYWVDLCKQSNDEQYIIKSVYIDLENPNEEYDEQKIDQSSTLLERLSLKYKWKELWKQEQTYKISEFSFFKILSIPLIVYGQVFWLTNFGAYNYYAFWEEIYFQFYVKFAIFSYYLPDVFFFISGFLLTRKLLQSENSAGSAILNSIKTKLLRLYPLYLAVLAIYWFISPALHAGPVWYVYQNQVSVCSSSWWRVLFMIDNWFSESCYPGLWFAQVEMQYTIFISVFFALYFTKRTLSYYYFGLIFLASFVLLFTLSAELPVSLDIALLPYTQIYFRSFYSHLWFYLLGVMFSILAEQESVRIKIQVSILENKMLNIVIKTLAFTVVMLILMRPSIWWGDHSLAVELAICRMGLILSVIVFFFKGMFKRASTKSVIHKYAYYMYPVLLISYMIVMCSFWSVGSFPYVSGLDLLNLTVPNVMISLAVGLFLGILFDTRTLHSDFAHKMMM